MYDILILYFSDQKLIWMKSELENIQKEREIQLKNLKMEYSNFQVNVPHG